MADAGAELLAPGTALPVSTCSYFAAVAEGEGFREADFDHSDHFARPLDSVVLATGFHAGCSAPIRQDGRAVGAVSVSLTCQRPGLDALAAELEALEAVLAPALAAVGPSRRRPGAVADAPHLTPREQELLEGLEEGLRFKQLARVMSISEATAKTHGRNLFRKLDATSRGEAVHAARTAGLLA